MVKLEEFIIKMELIKEQADKSKGKQRMQLLKCYHRMKKEIATCYYYIHKDEDIKYVKAIKRGV